MEKQVLQIQVFNDVRGANDHLKRNLDWWFVQAVAGPSGIMYILGTDVSVA
jgi:hypothetical protein